MKSLWHNYFIELISTHIHHPTNIFKKKYLKKSILSSNSHYLTRDFDYLNVKNNVCGSFPIDFSWKKEKYLKIFKDISYLCKYYVIWFGNQWYISVFRTWFYLLCGFYEYIIGNLFIQSFSCEFHYHINFVIYRSNCRVWGDRRTT